MRICSVIICGLIASFLPECIHDSGQRITDGVYREPSKAESLTVKGQSVTLELVASKGPRLGKVSGTYQYEILTNKELRFGASSNDSFFVFTVLAYDWIWDGSNIIRTKRENGEKVVFSPQTEGVNP